MAIAYCGARISPHMTRTPEGYLICHDVPINRTGQQEYQAGELQLDGDPDRLVIVRRYPEDVFDPAALASFEGKDITQGHPPENLTPENQAAYSKGHVENVRRMGDNTIADLYIKDPGLASDVENGIIREVSCGYTCTYIQDGNGYRQKNIRGNHVAVVPRGRAGHDVAIKDAAPEAEKGRNDTMSKFAKAILTAFSMAAKDATPEEMDNLVTTTATALDAAPAEPDEGRAQEAAPAEKPAENTMDSKLEIIMEMLAKLMPKEKEEDPMHDEGDLDKVIAKMAGKGAPEASVTVPAGEMEDRCKTMSQDAAVNLLRRVRPAVAEIKDKRERARVVDALLSAVKGPDMVSSIMSAVQDSARKNAAESSRGKYEKVCADAESAYAARNPHKKKEV